MAGGAIFGWAVMAGGTVAVICWLDFIQRNLPETLGDDYSDADSRTAALRNMLNEKPAAKSAGGERRNIGQRASALRTSHSHNQTRLVRTQDKLPST